MCELLHYPSFELDLKAQIEQHNTKWYEFIKDQDMSLAELYVNDGFYPFYTKQNKKILFIGQESLDIPGENYIETLFNAYHKGIIGEYPLNSIQNTFHSLILYVAWGLLHNCPNYKDIPEDTDIAKDFATETGISFAFMNLSKFTNVKTSKADTRLINKFLEISSQYDGSNLMAEEIRIIDPNLIISMLHSKEFHDKYERMGEVLWTKKNDEVNLGELTLNLNSEHKKYDIIDVEHFRSVLYKPNPNSMPWEEKCEKYVYNPIMEAYQSLESSRLR